MSVTFDEMRARVRQVLGDAEGNYWSDDELDRYMNEGQLEFVRHTHALRAEAPITVRENQDQYTLPEDCLEILRIEDKDGLEVEPTSARALQDRYGDFRSRRVTSATESPDFYYADLDGEKTIRFHPRPKPAIDEALVGFEHVSRFGQPATGTGVGLFTFEDDFLYYITATTITRYAFDGDDLLTGSANTTWTGLTALSSVAKVLPSPYHDYSDYYYTAQGTSSIGVFDSWGDTAPAAIGLTGTATELIGASFNRRRGNLNNGIFFGGSSTNVGYANADTATETILLSGSFTVFQFAFDEPNELAYVALGSDGLYSLTRTTATQISTKNTQGVAVANGVVYVTTNEQILYKVVDGALVLVDTDTDRIATTGKLISDREDRLLVSSATAGIAHGSVYNTVTSAWETSAAANQYEIYLLMDTKNNFTTGYGGRFYFWDSEEIFYSDRDEGFCSLIDEIIVTENEEGSIVDIVASDNEDIFVFSQEEGVVVQLTQTSVGAHVYYVKKPAEGIIEIADELAIEHYALYRAYQKDADQSNMAKAQIHYGIYQNSVSREKRKGLRGYNRNSQSTKGYHF